MKTRNSPNNVDLLFCLRGANMQTTGNQALTACGLAHFASQSMPFTKFKITDIFAVCTSGGVTVACTGGILTVTGAIQVIAAAQSWTGLSAVDKVVRPTVNAAYDTDIITLPVNNVAMNLNLTVGSTAACIADFYVFGFPLY